MRISDWSSDVCSSDLKRVLPSLRSLLGPHRRTAVITLPVQRFFPQIVWMPNCFLFMSGLARAWTALVLYCLNAVRPARSEEHTSELQSLMRISYAVFCLKKKKHEQSTYHIETQQD